MVKNELLKKYKAHMEELRPVLSKGLGDLFQKPVMISEEVEEAQQVNDLLSKEEFPKIALLFQTGNLPQSISHLILCPNEFVLSAYAWMVGEEPAKEVDENHLEGLKEIFNQMMGQIRMAIPDDEGKFNVQNLQAGLIEKPEDAVGDQGEAYGAKGTIKLTSEDQIYYLIHYVWSENWALEEGAEEEQIAVDESGQVSVEPAQFGGLGGNGRSYEAPGNIEMLLDVDLEITVELDRKTMLVSDLLKLGKGSIIEFPKSAGEPLDILVNGRKFAEGEVVVIDDKFGVRITQLISPKERIKKLA